MSSLRKQVPLDQLRPGDRAVIVRMGGERVMRRRLLAMGMAPGAAIAVKKVAPLGDPLELEVRNYQLSLRKQEAHAILVEVTAGVGTHV